MSSAQDSKSVYLVYQSCKTKNKIIYTCMDEKEAINIATKCHTEKLSKYPNVSTSVSKLQMNELSPKETLILDLTIKKYICIFCIDEDGDWVDRGLVLRTVEKFGYKLVKELEPTKELHEYSNHVDGLDIMIYGTFTGDAKTGIDAIKEINGFEIYSMPFNNSINVFCSKLTYD